MKKIFRMALVFALAGATLMYTGCTKDFEEEINKLDSKLTSVQTDLSGKLSDLEGQVSTLKSGVASLESAYKAADSALEKAYKDADTAIKNDVSGLKTRVGNIEEAIKDLDKLAKKSELADVKAALEQKIADDIDSAKQELLAKAQELQGQIDLINETLALKADAKDVYTKDEVAEILLKYYTSAKVDELLALKADADSVYTKEEVLGLLAQKADADKVYTKEEIATILADYMTAEEVQALLDKKADADKVYTKDEIAEILKDYLTAAEVQALLDKKADADAVYTKEEIKEILADYYTAEKVDEILADYVTKADLAEILLKYYTAEQIDKIFEDYYTKDKVYTKEEIATILADYMTAAEVQDLLDKKADADKVYTKDEVDTMLEDYFTKAEINEMFENYYTKDKVYTKDEVDEMLEDYYTAAEIDEMLEAYYTAEQIDENFYTKADIDEMLEDYFTKEEINEMFEDYYTSAKIDEILENYYTAEEIEDIKSDLEDAQNDLNDLFELLSDELRSIVFLPDLYFAGVEATSYDFATFVTWEPVALTAAVSEITYEIWDENLEDYKDTTVALVDVYSDSAAVTFPKGAKTEVDLAWDYYKVDALGNFVRDENGLFISGKEGQGFSKWYYYYTQGQIGAAKYDLNPSTFPVDQAEWSLRSRDVDYIVKSGDVTLWTPVFESIEKNADGLATVTYSILNPEYLYTSVIGAFYRYHILELPLLPRDVIPSQAISKYSNVATMQLVGTLSDDRDIRSDWHAISSTEELVHHLAFRNDNKWITKELNKNCDLGYIGTTTAEKDLYYTAYDVLEDAPSVKVMYNGGPVDLAELIAIHTVVYEYSDAYSSYYGDPYKAYTLAEFNAKYPGYHFEFEIVPYTIGGKLTGEQYYGQIDGTNFTPCYVQSMGALAGDPVSVPIAKNEESADGISSVGRMPMVLATLVNDDLDIINTFGYFRLLIVKEDLEPRFFVLPDLPKVPYICGLFNLSTVWHEFSWFVLETLKVDYEYFVNNYKLTGIYAYDKKNVFTQIAQGTIEPDKYLDLKLDGASLGKAMYSKDVSGAGINDAFSWLVNPTKIADGKKEVTKSIWFQFTKGSDDIVYFEMDAVVALKAKKTFATNKINKEWWDDVNGEALNTVRVNVYVPTADEENPYYDDEVGGDVMHFYRDLNEYFIGYKPILGLADDADEIYKNFYNKKNNGTDPDEGDLLAEGALYEGDTDLYDDEELKDTLDYYFDKVQPKIADVQLYSNWWGDVDIEAYQGELRVPTVTHQEYFYDPQGPQPLDWYTTEPTQPQGPGPGGPAGAAWNSYVEHGSQTRVVIDEWGYEEVDFPAQSFAAGKLLYVAMVGEDGKQIDTTVEGKGKFPKPVAGGIISGIMPRTLATTDTGIEYYSDTITYFNNANSRYLLNLWRHTETETSKMLYANVDARVFYGSTGCVSLGDYMFHVRFLRPLDVDFESQDVSEESAVDGWNVEVAKFISGIVDWNGIPVITKEIAKDADGKPYETGYYVENIVKTVNMFKYYVFKQIRIDLAKAEVNNMSTEDPEQYFLLSEAMPKAELKIGTVELEDAEGNPIEKKDWVFTPSTDIFDATTGIATLPVDDFEMLKGIVLNYRNRRAYSDVFTLKIKVSVDYSWGTLEDYLYINVDNTTAHGGSN